jgi:hypothetical protein
VPFLSFAAELALARFQAFVVQATLQVPAVVRRTLNEYLRQWRSIPAGVSTESPFRVEVVGRDPVVRDQLLQAAVIVAGGRKVALLQGF